MNLLPSKNWAEINAIKKQRIIQKFNLLFSTNLLDTPKYPFVLFFHYNGSKAYNWELVKKKISERGINYKGLFVPSNLHSVLLRHVDQVACTEALVDTVACNERKVPGKKHEKINFSASLPPFVKETATIKKNQKGMWRYLTKGPTLIIGCSSTKHMCAINELCTFPTFCCIGGLYKNNMLTHLDIKRWIFLQQQGDDKSKNALLSTLLYQNKRVLAFNYPVAVHSLLYRNLMSLLLLLDHKKYAQ